MKKRISAILMAVVMVLSLLPVGAFTLTAQAESTWYNYEVFDDGTAKIVSYFGKETAVTVPAFVEGRTVTTIGEMAFYGCRWVTEIFIPCSVTVIEPNAFGECEGLAIVRYEGTAAERYAIDIQDEESNHYLTNAVWYYGESGVHGGFDDGSSDGSSDGSDAPGSGDITDDHACAFEETYRQEATCTDEGYAVYACPVCKKSYTDSIPAIGHHFEAIRFDDGTTRYVCANCGETESGGEEHRHDYVVLRQADATCTEEGTVTYMCYGCKETYTETSPAIGHNYVTEKTAEGGTVTYCLNCGDVKAESGGEEHRHDYVESYREDATCARDGLVMYTCIGCGDSYNEDVPAIGHSFEDTVVDGAVVRICANCGETERGDDAPHAHDYVVLRQTDATCTEEGTVTYMCYGCKETYTETTPAIGHNYVTEKTAEGGAVTFCLNCGDVSDATDPSEPGEGGDHEHSYTENGRVGATCTEDGYIEYYCDGCGDAYLDPLPAIGHSFEDTVVDGAVVRICANCGETERGGDAPHVHDYVVLRQTDATCTEEGTVEYACDCGESYVETTPAVGHSFDDGKVTSEGVITYTCSACGATETEEFDPNEPQIVVESKTVSVGKQVEVSVIIKNNPGFSWLSLTLEHAPELELVKVQNGTLISDFTSGRNLLWAPDDDVSDDGVLMTAVFNVSEAVQAGEYDVSLTFNECYNGNEEDVSFVIMDGTVTVIDYVYGDANGDDTVDGKDVIRLKKYLANYNYDTDSSTVVLGPQA